MVSWERRPPGQPLVIGHRGASALLPENSLEAFARAGADGADGVELDVLCCATGEVMVFHDDDLARLGGRPDRIADLPYAELRDLKLTSGARIPTLAEALEVCGPRLLVNVELKASGLWGGPIGALVERVAAVVEQQGAGARVLVSSFHPRAVRRWRQRVPAIPAGQLFERESMLPVREGWVLPWVRPQAVHPEAVLCTPARVAGWHQRGYLVNVWTVDAADALRSLSAMGVDGLITNDPARARAALRGAAVHQ